MDSLFSGLNENKRSSIYKQGPVLYLLEQAQGKQLCLLTVLHIY